MGMEETVVCLDKEPHSFTAYSNEDFDTSTEVTYALHHEIVDCFEQLSGSDHSQMLEESSDSKEYEVKECMTEKTEPTVVNLDSTEELKILVKSVRNGMKEKPYSEPYKQKIVNKESPAKHSLKISPRCVRSSCTTPKPFTLATEKRASAVASPVTEGAINYELKFFPMKDSRLKKIIESLISRKPLRAEYKKHPEEQESSSVASSTAVSIGTPKKKMAISTPKFQCSERAEKRKEFYSKLEEKQLAIEAEKIQHEARAKEETEASIKQLRKRLTFKATPLPSFYHDGPLPNIELRKLPTTRPISPKLGRQKSYSDAPTPFQVYKIKGAHAQEHCASLSNYNGKTFEPNGCYRRGGEATSVFKAKNIPA
ncbi:hypothetical protein QQ045_028178 [Rhodiola kirilowii]